MNSLESAKIRSPNGIEEECAKFIIDDISQPFILHGITNVGQQYTFGVWLQSSVVSNISIEGFTLPASTEWVKQAVTFTAIFEDLEIYFDSPGTYYFYHSQLEIGNKDTDYRPNPDDAEETMEGLEARTAIYETKIIQNENSIASVASRTTANETAISMLEQTADGFEARLLTTENNTALAQTTAKDAAKTATNYLGFTSSNGLIIGDMTTETLGQNIQIKSDGIYMRNGDAELARFKSDTIDLGINAEKARINLCGGVGWLVATDTGDGKLNTIALDGEKVLVRGTYCSLATTTQNVDNNQSYEESAFSKVYSSSSIGETGDSLSEATLYSMHVPTNSKSYVMTKSCANDPYVVISAGDSSNTSNVIVTPTGVSIGKSLTVLDSINIIGTSTLGDVEAGGTVNVGGSLWTDASSTIGQIGFTGGKSKVFFYSRPTSYTSVEGEIWGIHDNSYGRMMTYRADDGWGLYFEQDVILKNEGLIRGRATGGTPYTLLKMSDSNTVNLGNTTYPTRIYGSDIKSASAIGTISDERVKKDFGSLERFERFFMSLNPLEYKYLMGATDTYHIGFKAQDVKKALEDNGLTTLDFAGYMESEIDKDYYMETLGYLPFTDKESGLRYSEFTGLIVHMVQKNITETYEHKDLIAELQMEISILKAQSEIQQQLIDQLRGAA